MPAPDAATSHIMIADSVRPSPRPPYSSGIIAPSQPASANALTNSQGYSSRLSFCRQYPRSNLRASSRADAANQVEVAVVGAGHRRLPFGLNI